MDRFYSKIEITDSCHLWIAGKNHLGYGQFKVKGRHIGAHRVAYALVHGWDSIEGKIVLHSCDNPSCVNPSHLSVGTQSQNVRESVLRGRHNESRKTECPHGHSYTKENTYITSKGHRQCIICRDIRNKKR